ncbi:putative metallo-hydrolase [Zhongshania aliphaticivorans]|uniref:Putative metallo-hydrolase n=1 Tax=Zhongshania aliphaticivorans TaxID=1470434 RepID=A0A5S9NGX5_9GAMM|nr:MBL fold metallo-hydrolase [Zhongshania aliphaticivorans]CAA0088860.1 putative metallo-hydrolase [Zhongshania aliphaticivorans]CAA0095297.1 putative metallo-hydrolase [Zhongshania aliphaticivorans]
MLHALLLCITLVSASAYAVTSEPTTAEPIATGLRFSILKTAEADVLEGMTYAGGSFFKKTTLNHIAVIIEHPQGSLLFDTGLGRQIDTQYRSDMPFWAKPFLTYNNVNPAIDQLQKEGVTPPERIILSHSHWDHASGVVDFPNAEIWLPQAEQQFIANSTAPAVLHSQLSPDTIQWHPIEFDSEAYENFDSSLDLFGDKSAVLVPLPGHSPGSVGLFLTTRTGGRYFFIGDLIWNANALATQAPKFWAARMIVDHDAQRAAESLAQVVGSQSQLPRLVIVPAHDQSVHDSLEYFPNWVN